MLYSHRLSYIRHYPEEMHLSPRYRISSAAKSYFSMTH